MGRWWEEITKKCLCYFCNAAGVLSGLKEQSSFQAQWAGNLRAVSFIYCSKKKSQIICYWAMCTICLATLWPRPTVMSVAMVRNISSARLRKKLNWNGQKYDLCSRVWIRTLLQDWVGCIKHFLSTPTTTKRKYWLTPSCSFQPEFRFQTFIGSVYRSVKKAAVHSKQVSYRNVCFPACLPASGIAKCWLLQWLCLLNTSQTGWQYDSLTPWKHYTQFDLIRT